MGITTWKTVFDPEFNPGGLKATNLGVTSILFDSFEQYTSDANLTATWSITTNTTATLSTAANALKARQSMEIAVAGGAGVIGRTIGIPFDERVRYISFRGMITSGTDTVQVRLGNAGNTVYREWDITVGTSTLQEHIIDLYSGGNGYQNEEGFPGPSGTAGTWDETVIDTLSFRGLANSSTFRFDEIRFYYERSLLEELVLGAGAGGLSGDAVLWELSDFDDFDSADADADTARWDTEYIANTDGTAAGTEGGTADIDTTTAGQAFVRVDPDATPTQAAYAMSRTLPNSSQYYTVVVDCDATLHTGQATSTFAGLRISNGAADDAANYVIIAKETSSGVDRITTVAEFGGVRTTPLNFSTTNTTVAFKIERLFNVWNCYYSLTQYPSWEWVKLGQWEDGSSNIGEITSVYLYAESAGTVDAQIATGNFDNFKYFIRSGAVDDILQRIGENTANNTYASGNVAANVDGSIMERLESIQAALSVNAAGAGEFEVDGSPDLWDALVVDTSTQADIISMTGDRDGAVIERLAAVENAIQITDAGTATGYEEDGTGGTIWESIVAVKGTFTTSSATVPADTGRSEADDYFNGDVIIPLTGSAAGQARVIVDFANAGGVFTIDGDAPFTAATGTVTYVILHYAYPLVPGADSTNNQTAAQVVGNKSDAALVTAGDASIIARLRAIEAALSVNAAGGGEFELDGSPDLWDALVVDSSTQADIISLTGDRDGAIIERLSAIINAVGINDAGGGAGSGFEEDGSDNLHDFIVTGANTDTTPNIAENGGGSVLERLEEIRGTTAVSSAFDLTAAHTTVEQTIANLTPIRFGMYAVQVDVNTLVAAAEGGNVIFRLYSTIDGSTLRIIDRADFLVGTDEVHPTVSGFAYEGSNTLRLTVQANSAVTANRTLPYRTIEAS